MRTTLTIDDDVLSAARQLADVKGIPLGQAISELARTTLAASGQQAVRNGILLLPRNPEAKGATLDEVNRFRDELS